MITRRVEEHTLPSDWASYLINADASGLESSEVDTINQWLKDTGLPLPVSSEEVGFRSWHDARVYGVMPCDCQVFKFLVLNNH